jgi:hypothetical protein
MLLIPTRLLMEGTTDSPSHGGHIMKADELTTDALDRLAALLDAGHSDQLTALFKAMSRFHKYSWHNVCLIASQRPTATRVAGFQAWRTLGRLRRRKEGSHGLLGSAASRHFERQVRELRGSIQDVKHTGLYWRQTTDER